MLKGCLCVLILVVMMGGCAQTTTKAPPVADQIRKQLDQSGIKGVTVAQDRTNGVVTLKGDVANQDAKTQAENIAKGLAGGQVVADEIAIVPSNAGHDARTLYADLDKGIQNNVDAALIQ